MAHADLSIPAGPMADRPLTRREFARLAAAAAVLPPLATLGRALPNPRRIATQANMRAAWPGYDAAIVIDCLASPGPFNVPRMFDGPLTPAMVTNARASGITAVNYTLHGFANGPQAFLEAMRAIAFAERELDAHPDALLKVKTVADLRAAKAAGKLGLIFGFQDATMLEDDVSRVDLFHAIGVRILQLTYNTRNLVGDGCLERGNGGLSGFGRAVVSRMNERGILVDLSHVGVRTTADAIAASGKPVAFTHSGCRALNDVPRNKGDAEIRALAERGGVMGIYLMPFLRASGAPSTEDLLRHIEHALDVAGEDHVGIGSDLSITPLELTPEFRAVHAGFVRQRRAAGIGAPGEAEDVFNYVPELNVPRRLELIAERLAARGHGSARIAKVLGGNWMRLFGEVWR